MLVNVFFGIVGTFWLRTQYRRGEMGLRSALGASRGTLKCFLNVEGLFLLIFTIPVVLVFIFNMLYFDLPDTDRLAYTWWRFSCHFRKQLSVAGRYDLARYLVPGTQDCKDESGGGFAL